MILIFNLVIIMTYYDTIIVCIGGTIMKSMLLDTYIPGWLQTLLDALTKIINPILILVATAGIVYAVVVGIKFAKADDKNEREEAKQKLIYVIVGIVVTAILIALFYWLSYAFSSGIIDLDNWWQ